MDSLYSLQLLAIGFWQLGFYLKIIVYERYGVLSIISKNEVNAIMEMKNRIAKKISKYSLVKKYCYRGSENTVVKKKVKIRFTI
jgi:hypothetical protein